MSVCGGCPYPYEAVLAGEYETEEDACSNGCSFEDAAYRAQEAYDLLNERYKALKQKLTGLEDDGK